MREGKRKGEVKEGERKVEVFLTSPSRKEGGSRNIVKSKEGRKEE